MIKTRFSRVPWKALLLAGFVFLVYLRAVHGQFLWDDDDYVTRNLALRSLAGLGEIWFHIGRLSQYYPLTYTSFWAEYHLWGLNPAGYHAVNILLHIANGLLVWRLLDQLKLKHAWFIGLLFALHPVHTESVAWITERKNLLSGLFYLAAAIAYLRSRYALSYLAFVGALLSKTVTATLPAALFLVLWWRDGKLPWKDSARLAAAALTAFVLSSVTVALENRHVLRTGIAEWSFSPAERLLIAGRAVWFYLAKLLWPRPLVFIYPRWHIDARDAGQWLYPVLFALLIAGLWALRRRVGRGPVAALAVFAVTLLPALGFKNYFPMRFSFVADHFQYLASIAPLALFVSLGAMLIKSARLQKTAACLLLAAAALLTWRHETAFSSQEALWRDTLRQNPAAWIAHNNLGAILMQKGMNEEAASHFREVFRLKPDHAEAFNNLGLLKLYAGKPDRAVPYFKKAIRLQPNIALFELNLGTALFSLGKTDEAAAHYRKAIAVNPSLGEAYFSLGNALLNKEMLEEAEAQFRQAVRFSPDFADAYASLGYVCAQLGKTEEAIAHYRKAIALDPNQAEAVNNLANALKRQKEQTPNP